MAAHDDLMPRGVYLFVEGNGREGKKLLGEQSVEDEEKASSEVEEVSYA